MIEQFLTDLIFKYAIPVTSAVGGVFYYELKQFFEVLYLVIFNFIIPLSSITIKVLYHQVIELYKNLEYKDENTKNIIIMLSVLTCVSFMGNIIANNYKDINELPIEDEDYSDDEEYIKNCYYCKTNNICNSICYDCFYDFDRVDKLIENILEIIKQDSRSPKKVALINSCITRFKQNNKI